MPAATSSCSSSAPSQRAHNYMAAGLCGAPREHDALSIMTVKVLEHRCLMLFYGTCSATSRHMTQSLRPRFSFFVRSVQTIFLIYSTPLKSDLCDDMILHFTVTRCRYTLCERGVQQVASLRATQCIPFSWALGPLPSRRGRAARSLSRPRRPQHGREREDGRAFDTRALGAHVTVRNRKIPFSRIEPAAAWMDPLST